MVVVISVSSVAAEQRFSLKNLVKSGSNSYLTEGKTLNEAKGGKNKTKKICSSIKSCIWLLMLRMKLNTMAIVS